VCLLYGARGHACAARASLALSPALHNAPMLGMFDEKPFLSYDWCHVHPSARYVASSGPLHRQKLCGEPAIISAPNVAFRRRAVKKNRNELTAASPPSSLAGPVRLTQFQFGKEIMSDVAFGVRRRSCVPRIYVIPNQRHKRQNGVNKHELDHH
jgi:hypothetical protein